MREERRLHKFGLRKRQPAANPFQHLLPTLQIALTPFKASQVEVVAGTVVTPANHGRLYRPPEQAHRVLPTSMSSRREVRHHHSKQKNQLLLLEV
jgi:hypothetical protein